MTKAFLLFFTRAFDFHGRTNRREFWLGILPNAVIMVILGGILLYSLLAYDKVINTFSIIMIALFTLFCLIELLPSLSLITRRMHDIGKSGYDAYVLLIPIVGFIWYIYLVTRKSDYFRKDHSM